MNVTESFLLHVFLQLAVIIAAARLGAYLFGKLGQPQVVGEILAGLILGPSVLGRLSPEALAFVFPSDAAPVFRVLSELGLTLLMFLIGLEFDFTHLRHVGRTAAGVAVAGIVLPFVMGAAVASLIHSHVAAHVNFVGFILFVAVALSITAIPILGRIMVELKIQRTRLGTLTITAAAVDDAIGWILLAAVSAIVSGHLDWLAVGRMLLLTLGFILGMWFLARPIMIWMLKFFRFLDGQELTLGGFAFVLVIVLLAAAGTNLIGIFSIFGPFVLGAVMSHEREFVEAVTRRLRPFVYAFFLPIFFTYTGLKTNVGSLESASLWAICGLILFAAVAGKTVGCGFAARMGGLSWPESGCVAVMMNTRALMGLIAVNVGRQLGVVPDAVFCMLVIMALVTTIVTTPLLRRMLPRTS